MCRIGHVTSGLFTPRIDDRRGVGAATKTNPEYASAPTGNIASAATCLVRAELVPFTVAAERVLIADAIQAGFGLASGGTVRFATSAAGTGAVRQGVRGTLPVPRVVATEGVTGAHLIATAGVIAERRTIATKL